MARARNIKPALFKNELLGVADPLLTLLFESLWCLADREGRLEDRPLRIKAETFPYRDGINIDGFLNELHNLGFIQRYKVDGQALIQIVNFKKHQTPHNTEKPSVLPEPITKALPLNNEKETQALPPDSFNLIPDSLIPDSGLPEDCAEPQSDSSPTVIQIPITAGREFSITQAHVDEWTDAYPAVDVIRQLAAMRQWCLANPTRRKTARGVLSFCNAWLVREQDKPHPQARGSPAPYESAKDRSRREASEILTGRRRNEQHSDIIDITPRSYDMG